MLRFFKIFLFSSLISLSANAQVVLLPIQKQITTALFKNFYENVFDFIDPDSTAKDKINLTSTDHNPCRIELPALVDFLFNEKPLVKNLRFRHDCPYEGTFSRSFSSNQKISLKIKDIFEFKTVSFEISSKKTPVGDGHFIVEFQITNGQFLSNTGYVNFEAIIISEVDPKKMQETNNRFGLELKLVQTKITGIKD